MYGGYILGEATAERRRVFDASLAAARDRFDLRAVVRAAGARGAYDPRLAVHLARFARGLDSDAWELEAKLEEARAAAGRVPGGPAGSGSAESASAGAPGLAAALRGLADGSSDRLVFLELGADGLTLAIVRVGAAGLPRAEEYRDACVWSSPEIGLSNDANERLFQLAGGVGDSHVSAAQFLSRLPRGEGLFASATLAQAGDAVVLVRRTTALPLLEAAAAALRGSLRPVAELLATGPEPLPDVVDEALRRAPLRDPIELVVAEVDPETGAVSLGSRPLFPAGSVAGEDGERHAEVEIAAHPASGAHLALPVAVVGGADAGPDRWRVLRTGRIALGPGDRATVRVILGPSGTVRFDAPAELADDDRPWTQIRDGQPKRIATAESTDVVIGLELGGRTPEAAQGRIEFAAETLAALTAALPGGSRLRVGLVGCGDHGYNPRRPADGPFPVHPLGDPAEAEAVLATWTPEPLRYARAAPLEEALHAALRMQPSATRRVLLLFASRPPHPPVRDLRADLLGCTAGLDWTDLARRAREQWLDVVVAVEESEWEESLRTARPAARVWALAAWAALGSQRVVSREGLDAAAFLRTAGLGPAAGARSLSLAVPGG